MENQIPLRRAPRGQGVRARCEPYPELTYEELLLAPPPHFFVGLDGVTDVGNLGSIARTSEAAGVTGLVLEQRRSPPIHEGALRASAGALEHLRVGRTPNLRKAMELARAEGFWVLVAEPEGQALTELPRERLRSDLLLVFGSEARGSRSGVRAAADQIVGVPSSGRLGSLGVSAAAAYVLLRLAELRQS